eukprot:7054328-Alexandrium_andersonii.AAC.1
MRGRTPPDVREPFGAPEFSAALPGSLLDLLSASGAFLAVAIESPSVSTQEHSGTVWCPAK